MFNASENMWDSIRLVIPSGLLWWMDALPRMDVHFNECSQHVLYNIMMHCHTYSHTPENTDVHTTRPNIYIYIMPKIYAKVEPLVLHTQKKKRAPLTDTHTHTHTQEFIPCNLIAPSEASV